MFINSFSSGWCCKDSAKYKNNHRHLKRVKNHLKSSKLNRRCSVSLHNPKRIFIMEQKELELKLLNLFNGDQEKYAKYATILSTCTKPDEVANRVVKPMFIEGYVSKDEISKKAFYGTLAELVECYNGHRIAPKSLYYHITANLSEWKKDKEAAQKSEPFRIETRIRRNADGSMEIFKYIYMKVIPDNVDEWLKAYIDSGNAEMMKNIKRNVMARGEDEVVKTKSDSELSPDIGQKGKHSSHTSYYIELVCKHDNTGKIGSVRLQRHPLKVDVIRTKAMMKWKWERVPLTSLPCLRRGSTPSPVRAALALNHFYDRPSVL